MIDNFKILIYDIEVFPNLLKSGLKVIGVVDNGYWLDLGTPAAFVKGSSDLVTGKIKTGLGIGNEFDKWYVHKRGSFTVIVGLDNVKHFATVGASIILKPILCLLFSLLGVGLPKPTNRSIIFLNQNWEISL